PPRPLGGLGAPRAEPQCSEREEVLRGHTWEALHRRRGHLCREPRGAGTVAAELVKEEPSDVGAEFFVEEVLELERSAALDRLRRVQRWLRVAFLERADDCGRVADAPAVELEDRRRVALAAGQRERERHVVAGHERAALVPDALQVERPSRLLVVVRDLDVPEDRAGVHLRLPKRLVPSASARGVAGTDRRGQPLRLGLDDRSLGNIASTARGSWHTDRSVGRYVR